MRGARPRGQLRHLALAPPAPARARTGSPRAATKARITPIVLSPIARAGTLMIRSKLTEFGVGAQRPEVGQRVLDLAPGVEAGAADDLVADPVAEAASSIALDWAFVRYRTAMSRSFHVAPSSARLVSAEPRVPVSSSTRRAIHSASSSSLYASKRSMSRPRSFCVHSFLSVRAVLRDDGVGGVEDQLGGAVVLLELDDGRIRPVALEVEDVPDVRAAPAVDRLVVVADDRQVAVLRGEGPDPQVLRAVRVLVLVDVEVRQRSW